MYLRCTHTKGNRVQECILVLVADRMGCIPIAAAENAVGKIASGLAMTAVGMIEVRLGKTSIDASHLATAEDLDAAIDASGGFHLGADWMYRTRIPGIGTMLMHGNEVITTREQVPPEIFAKLTPNTAPGSTKPVKVACAIGAGVLVIAGIAYLATGNLEVLFGIGFWGVLIIAASLGGWWLVRRT